MAGPDATARLALGASVVRPRFLCWLDIVGDPVRATTWPIDLTPTGTGDAELDGFTFSAINPDLVTISAITDQEGGSDTVVASLSGLIGPNADLLTIIGNPANWRGRIARLWMGVADADYMPQGAIWAYYTGRMVSLSIKGSPEAQTIEVAIENYLAALTPASNRTYLDQATFDPLDTSAAASIAIANGLGAPSLAGFGGGSGTARGGDFRNQLV